MALKGSRSVKSKREALPVMEMLEIGMKNFFNENKPRFGTKHYRCVDTMFHKLDYKIKAIAINKKDTKDSFFESVIKKTNCTPGYKHNNVYDWSNNFKNRGKIMKNDKITFTAEVI